MFNSGHDLTKLHQSASKYAREAMQHKQLTVANGIVTILSAVLELTGIASSKDGAYKSIFYCTEDVLYQQLASKNEVRSQAFGLLLRDFPSDSCVLLPQFLSFC